MKSFRIVLCLNIGLVLGCRTIMANPDSTIVPLHVEGEHFVTDDGAAVRLWGVNLVACYPTHEESAKLAENLASLGVNVVRPHHMMRPSSDWVTRAPVVALNRYGDSTREPDPEAWDRFDYLNTELRKRGIYLMLSIQSSRKYRPGDVDVLATDDADREAWIAAMSELNSWDWKKSIDPRKSLAVIDERAAALDIEFARQMLTHVNPYTGLAYGKDPQVLTIEAINESSLEYAVICNNRFPDYWQRKLEAQWQAFTQTHGLDGGDLYQPANDQLRHLRAQFLRQLEQDYFARLRAAVRETGSTAAVAFSNLWRGESALQWHAAEADYIEDHLYMDPLVVRQADDLFARAARSQVAGKPFIVGELNQSENPAAMKRETPVRTMLPLAAAAYGSLQNWSGVVWFAWIHGDKALGADGWSLQETRDTNIGQMISDGMQIDHLRTAGLMFRRQMVAPCAHPITLYVDEPLTARGYHELMRGKVVPQAGWQNIHAIRKVFGSSPDAQTHAAWMTQSPSGPLVSDTGQIIKDTARQQLTVAVPQAEAFSGVLDGEAPASLRHLSVAGEGFATVIVVAADEQNLSKSRRLIISRTNVNASGEEQLGPTIRLLDLAQPGESLQWSVRVARPRATENQRLTVTADHTGAVTLPDSEWHECELEMR